MRTFSLCTVLALTACATPPPPVAQQPEPIAIAPPPPAQSAPPPPPPRCEALAEKCLGGPDSRVGVGAGSVRPPLGWTYAKETGVSVMVAPNGDGVLAFNTASGEDAEGELLGVVGLLTRLGVSDVKATLLKTRLKKAQSTVIAEAGTVKLWEVDAENHGGVDPKREGKPGAALIAIARVGNAVIVGVGFVPKTAPAANVAAMMEAIKSLRGTP